MKSFKKFQNDISKSNLIESVNISGNASVGTIIIGGSPQNSSIEEKYVADVMWQGNLYRMELVAEGDRIPSRNELAEQIQNEYPGAIVHNVYPITNQVSKIVSTKRYQPEKLTWTNI
jgi:hypothetical protein